MSRLTSDYRILETLLAGDIVGISFGGTHGWTHGQEMARFIKQTLADTPAIAVLINLLDYEYRAGDDVSGLFEAFMDRERDTTRPACIVATGTTYQSLHGLFGEGKLLDLMMFAASIEDALVQVRSRLADQDQALDEEGGD